MQGVLMEDFQSRWVRNPGTPNQQINIAVIVTDNVS